MIKNAVEQFSSGTGNTASAALIGGYAAIYFGSERTTLDVDICFYSPDDKSGLLFSRFLSEHLSPRFTLNFFEASNDPSDSLKHNLIVINDSKDEYPRIDILIVRYKWELGGLQQSHVAAGLSFPIMPMPHLIAMKLMAGGRKDELDIINMLKGLSDEELKKTKELAIKIKRDKNYSSLLIESKE